MHGIVETAKNMVFQKVFIKSELVTIHTLFDFYQAAMQFVRVTCILRRRNFLEARTH